MSDVNTRIGKKLSEMNVMSFLNRKICLINHYNGISFFFKKRTFPIEFRHFKVLLEYAILLSNTKISTKG